MKSQSSLLQKMLISVAAIGLTAAVARADETPAAMVKASPGAIIGSVRNADKGLGVQSTSKVPNCDFRGPYHIDLLGA